MDFGGVPLGPKRIQKHPKGSQGLHKNGTDLQLYYLLALRGDGDEVEKKVRALRTETADHAAQWNIHRQIKLVPGRSYMFQ